MSKIANPENRILVIQTAFLGDIVLASSFLNNLRNLCRNSEIRFLTTPAGAKVFDPNPMGVVAIPYDKRGNDAGFGGFLRIARELGNFAPDLVFCLHRSLRSALLAKISGGKIYGFEDAAGSVLFHHRVKRPKGVFEAEKNHQLLLAWKGSEAEGMSAFPLLSFSEKDRQEGEALLSRLPASSFIAIAPSSVWATKRWPAEYFGDLAERLWDRFALPIVLVGGREPADLKCASEVEMHSPRLVERGAIFNLVGKTGIGTLKSVLSRAGLVIANDSAPLHIAIAVGAPVLGIFGPTTRELGFFPNAPVGKSAVAEIGGLACRPCGLHGHHQCPQKHFSCMLELLPEKVFEEAEKLLCL